MVLSTDRPVGHCWRLMGKSLPPTFFCFFDLPLLCYRLRQTSESTIDNRDGHKESISRVCTFRYNQGNCSLIDWDAGVSSACRERALYNRRWFFLPFMKYIHHNTAKNVITLRARYIPATAFAFFAFPCILHIFLICLA